MSGLIDASQRQRALDVGRSFLVQAPAGSGKTGLLIQRFLGLLLTVRQHPEECLAITFTRKAASEMRERLVDALLAAKGPAPTEDYARQTWDLAKLVLDKDQSLKWHLIENPQRLKILTFDAFCASLTRAMPVMANFGFQPKIRENPQELYEVAVARLLQNPKRLEEIAQSYSHVLTHLDNQKLLLKRLLIELLGQREQWLSPVLFTQQSDLSQAHLEQSLTHVVEHYLQLAAQLTPRLDLPVLARFAASHLTESTSPLLACESLTSWPASAIEDLKAWQGIAELCLTAKGELRKKLTLKQGFPPASKASSKAEKTLYQEKKQQMETMLSALENVPDFVRALQRVQILPPVQYQSKQWQVLSGLAQILLYAVAELALVFQEAGEVDFAEISIAASRSLGAMEEPSDLALALDYRIQHIMVDEFQDTSIAQFELLKALTAGFEVGDGRSLFLVGDPMQSIYRFRQAEVGLFLAVKHQGVGELPMEFLQLQANFRSEPMIVNWVNQTFQSAFPKTEDLSLGAIPYSTSMAVKPQTVSQVHMFINDSEDSAYDWEAQKIVDFLLTKRATAPGEQCAILVRSRSHLLDIIPKLQAAAIPYQGVDIDLLANKPEIQDLLALTRAMVNFADRSAWLAILRAPWCGLDLVELTLICDLAGDKPLWEVIPGFVFEDKPIASERLALLTAVIQYFLERRANDDLATWLYKLWLGLEGPKCYAHAEIETNAQVFFHTLSEMDERQIYQKGVLEEKIAKQYTKTEATAKDAVQIMTIHKAKGLEFDTVILPGLGRKPPADAHRLFVWQEWTQDASQHHLVMAPIQPHIEKAEPIYDFLRQIEKEKQQHEALRLLYVAATRAKKELVLLGDALENKPARHSLLRYIWPAIYNQVEKVTVEQEQIRTQKNSTAVYQRIADAAVVHKTQQLAEWQCEEKASLIDPIHLEQLKMRAIGTVVHQMLYRIVAYHLPLDALGLSLSTYRPLWRAELAQLAVSGIALDEAVGIVETAIVQTLEDKKGQWILAPREQSFAEYPVVLLHHHQTQKMILDRLFIENDCCWIVDYKTCANEDIDKVASQYQQQLNQYIKAVKKLFPTKAIQAGLYFPLQQLWVDYDSILSLRLEAELPDSQ